ncbi:alpha-ketoglutarate-dependent dioxygenase AlkB [Sphingomonas naphthae]|uniref:Alpha-ketoglutarate-dependent dioxygenase AlkB n=1 Tax=Sphingomonas naphthae TaxID=1813468 RepID=A0ABY7THL0_9SPHN|nr:alpha-ketoglutarate-dependent dioxygenase AlkB [Sphingomonas naphthae]WCT72650.1 alpha-ketoglutarate-dependent dioxygenase AlkB [Sphingomonas naphthae]
MLDLFNSPLIPGLTSRDAIVSPDEEASLIEAIDATDLAPFRFQGWTGKRVTHPFGWNYDFDTREVARAAPIPDWLLPIRRRMADFAGIGAEQFVQALLIRYDPGAGIGWHRDRPIYEHVIGLSLGAPAEMRFRRRRSEGGFDRITIPLEPRAAYHLAGDARHEWEHSIAEMEQQRWSVTFRSPSARGRSILNN